MATTRTAPRRYIESQLSPAVQAFGFHGGWSLERPTARKFSWAELDALAAEIPPWACAGPGCARMIRWEPRDYIGFRKCCSKQCSNRYRGTKRRVRHPNPEIAARNRQHYRQWRAGLTPEQRERERARKRDVWRRCFANRTPEQIARRRDYERLRSRRRCANWTPEERARALECQRRSRHRRGVKSLTPPQFAQRRELAQQRTARRRAERQERTAYLRSTALLLRQHLRAHGIKQREIARRLGIGEATVSEALAGTSTSRRVVDMARRMIEEACAKEPTP